MKKLHIHTPLIESVSLSKKLGQDVFLKLDAFQPPGSFKIRGIGHLCQVKAAEGYSKFISPSGGNAGMATAYAARELGKTCQIILPKTIPESVQDKLKDYGAEVTVFGDTWEEAEKEARRLVEQDEKAFFVHPFDHEIMWEGHASLSRELKEDGFKPDVIILAVGGGGLLAGVKLGLDQLGWHDVAIIGCETSGTNSFEVCKKTGKHEEIPSSDSIATSLAALKVSNRAFEISQLDNSFSYTCSDELALKACKEFALDHRILVEPACGAALSVIYEKSDLLKNYKKIAVIICGGINIHESTLNLLNCRQNQQQGC